MGFDDTFSGRPAPTSFEDTFSGDRKDLGLNPVQTAWRGYVRPILEKKPPYLKEILGDVGEQAYSGAIGGLTFSNVQPDVEGPESKTEKFAYHAAHLGGFGTSLAAIGLSTKLAAKPAVLGAIAGSLEDTGEDFGSKEDLIARGKGAAWMAAQFKALGLAGGQINKHVTSKLLTGVLKDVAKDPGKAAVIKRVVSDYILGSGLGAAEPTEAPRFSAQGMQEMAVNAALGGGAFVVGSSLGEQALRYKAGKQAKARQAGLEETLYTATAFNRRAEADKLFELRGQEGKGGALRNIFPFGFEGARTQAFQEGTVRLASYLPKDSRKSEAGQPVTLPSAKLSKNIQEGPKVPETLSNEKVENKVATKPGTSEIQQGKNKVRMDSIDQKLRQYGYARNKSLKEVLKGIQNKEVLDDVMRQLEQAPNSKVFSHWLNLAGKLSSYTTTSTRQDFLDSLAKPRSLDKFSEAKGADNFSDIDRLDALMFFAKDTKASAKDINKFANKMFGNIPTIAAEQKVAKEKIKLEDIRQKEEAKQLGVRKAKSPSELGELIRAKKEFDTLKEHPDILALYVSGDMVANEVGMNPRQIAKTKEKLYKGIAETLRLDPNKHWRDVKDWVQEATKGLDKKTEMSMLKDKEKGIKTEVVTEEVTKASEEADKIIEPKKGKKVATEIPAENLDELAYKDNFIVPNIGPVLVNEKAMGAVHGREWDGTDKILTKIAPAMRKEASKAGKRFGLFEHTQIPEEGPIKTAVVYDGPKVQAVLKKHGIKESADNFIKRSYYQNFLEGTRERIAIDEMHQVRATSEEMLQGKPVIEVRNERDATDKGVIEKDSGAWLDKYAPEMGFEPTEGSVFMYVPNAYSPKGKEMPRRRFKGFKDTAPPIEADVYVNPYDGLENAKLLNNSTGIFLELDSVGLKNMKMENDGSVRLIKGGENSPYRVAITNQRELPYKTVWITDKADASTAMVWARKAMKEGKLVYRVPSEKQSFEGVETFDIQPAAELAEDLNALWRLGVMRGGAEGDSALHDIPPVIPIAENLRAYARNPVNKHETVRSSLDEVVFGLLGQSVQSMGETQNVFLKTPQWAKFEKSYTTQHMLEILRSQGIFRPGTNLDMKLSEAVNYEQYAGAEPAGVAFRSRKYSDVIDHKKYQSQVNKQSIDSIDADKFEAQMYVFLSQTRNARRLPQEVNKKNSNIKTVLNLFDIEGPPELVKQAQWYKNKLSEFHQQTELNEQMFSDIKASAEAFNEGVALVAEGDIAAPFKRLVELRTQLKTDLLRLSPKNKTISEDMVKNKLKYQVAGFAKLRDKLKWAELFKMYGEDSPFSSLIKNRGVKSITAYQGKRKAFGVEAGEYGKSFVAKKYQAGYTKYDNERTKLTSAIAYLDSMIRQGKNVLEPAARGVNSIRVGKVLMNAGERAEIQFEITEVEKAIKSKSDELQRNTNPDRQPEIVKERQQLVDRMTALQAELQGTGAAKKLIEAQPEMAVTEGTPLLESDNPELRSVGEHYRAKTRGDTTPWTETISQWMAKANDRLGWVGNNRGSALVSESGSSFPLFKKIARSFKGLFSFPPEPAKTKAEVLKRNVIESDKRNGRRTGEETFFDHVRDVEASNRGMELEIERISKQKTDDLNLAATYGDPVAKRYEKKLTNWQFWKDGISGKMGKLFRAEKEMLKPYFSEMALAQEAVVILDPSQPHIYSFAREANRVNPKTGRSKRESFEGLPPHVKQWVVQNAADYRLYLDKGIQLNFFDAPDKILDSYYSHGFDHTVPLHRKTGAPMSDAFGTDPTMNPGFEEYKKRKSLIDRQDEDMPELLNPINKFEMYVKDFVRKANAVELSERLQREVMDDSGLPLLAYESGRTRIGNATYTGADLRAAGYEKLKGGTEFSKFNVQTKMKETPYVHPEIHRTMEDLYGEKPGTKSPALKTLQRWKGVARAVTLWSPFDNAMYTIGALNGALGPLGMAKATFGPKSWLNWKNTYATELKTEMSHAGVNTATYTSMMRGLYDNFKQMKMQYGTEEAGLLKRAWRTLEGAAHEKGGLDEKLFKVIDNASAFMFERSRDKFMAQGLNRAEAGKLAADYVNTALYVPHDYTYGKYTGRAARWMLISRNMSFTRIRMFTGALDPKSSVFGGWFRRNFAHHGLNDHEVMLLQKQFQSHMLNEAMVFGLGTALISYMLTAANTGQGKYPWEYDDPSEWFKIHTGMPHPNDPKGREMVISNPLMKDFTDAALFSRVPIDLLTFQPPRYILNKTDMSIKSLLQAYVGGKILPTGPMDMTPPGATTTFKVNKALENILVDGGPLNPFKGALDAMDGSVRDPVDPISLVADVAGFNVGKGKGPAVGGKQYVQMQSEMDRVSFFRRQAREKLKQRLNMGIKTDKDLQEVNRLKLVLQLSPSELMKMDMAKKMPFMLKSRDYQRRMSKSGGITAWGEEEGI